MKFRSKRILVAVVIAVILTFGIPILINEYYKHGGYITMWEAADVLSYYGTILGSFIAVTTLAITILFTRKQIQRETYLHNTNEHWSKIGEIFTATLKAISPIPPMKESIERGQTDPSEAIKAFQRYQMSCQTALDEIISYLNSADYLKVKELIDQITATSNQCFQVAEEEIAAYEKLRNFNGRISAQQALDTETKYPSSFSAHTLDFCKNLLQNTDGLSYEIISQNIGQINEKLVATYENSYRPLLALKRTVFEQINNEVQKKADSILHLWRK